MKKYSEIISTAWPYCGGYCCLAGNPTCAAPSTEVTEAYGDDHAQIMVSSDIEPEVRSIILLVEVG